MPKPRTREVVEPTNTRPARDAAGAPSGRGSRQGELYRLTFEQAAAGMALISPDLVFLRTNASLSALLGYASGELSGLPIDLFLHPEERRRGWRRALAPDRHSFHLERRLVHKDGRALWVHLSVSRVRDPGGRLLFYVAMAEDITDRREEETRRERRQRELQALATTDQKTGLYNHGFMQEFLAHRLAEAKRNRESVSLLMLDLDRFRELNEQHGHDSGDRALSAVAGCLTHGLREGDVACRYGGEEFVLVLATAPFAAALAVAERLRERVAGCGPVAVHAGPITCSIGVASFPEHASTPASLLKAADLALYQAKHAGRNQVCGYSRAEPAAGGGDLTRLRSGLEGAGAEAVKALVTAIDLRDRYTGAHGQRVARLALDLAEAVGCTAEEREILRLGAPLLDVGKIGLPDHLLTKPGSLTRAEWELVRLHPIWGEQLLAATSLPRSVQELVRWHHERQDGSGYPDGLNGAQIPRVARIAAVADVGSALRDDRPHRRAWHRKQILDHLRDQAGTKLDEEIVAAYCRLHGEPPAA